VEQGPSESDPLGGDDPFEGLVFDEAFVESAAIVEASAEQREREARQANLQRLLADQAAQRENALHAHRRFAPEDDPYFDIDPDELPPRRSGRTVVAIVVVLSIFVVYALSHFFSNDGGPETPASTTPTTIAADGDQGSTAVDPGTSTAAGTATRPSNWPSPPGEESAAPLGSPGAVPEGGGPHSFVQLQADGTRPVAYDPCRPIHYVTRSSGEPEGAGQLVTDAVASVSAATGLQFIDDGATDESPSDDRASFQPERYGDRWAPILIAWSEPGESPSLGEEHQDTPEGAVADVLGYAGSASTGFQGSDGDPVGDQVFVTGGVTLDGPDFVELLGQFDGYARARAVVLHEVGHLVGLGHVDDPSQLMSPVLRSDLTEYAAGDRQGLAQLGQGACLAQV
jgi:Matrixin